MKKRQVFPVPEKGDYTMKKTMNIFLSLLLVLSLGLTAACAETTDSSADDIKNRKLTEEELAVATHVIENFVALSAALAP